MAIRVLAGGSIALRKTDRRGPERDLRGTRQTRAGLASKLISRVCETRRIISQPGTGETGDTGAEEEIDQRVGRNWQEGGDDERQRGEQGYDHEGAKDPATQNRGIRENQRERESRGDAEKSEKQGDLGGQREARDHAGTALARRLPATAAASTFSRGRRAYRAKRSNNSSAFPTGRATQTQKKYEKKVQGDDDESPAKPARDLDSEIQPENDGPTPASAEARHGKAVIQVTAVERRAGAKAGQQPFARA